MQSVKFKPCEECYSSYDASTIELCHLGNFLSSDVNCGNIARYMQWILDDSLRGFGGNYSSVQKEGEYLFMGCDFDDASPPLKIHRDQLIKILDAWEQFCKTKPKEIIITQDGEMFNIEGIF